MEHLPTKTFQKKVKFVKIGNLEEESEKLINSKSKQSLQAPPLATPNSTNKSKPMTSHKKTFVRRSCFSCHEKWHVASCCPNKKSVTQYRQITREKSPVKTDNQQGTSSNSHTKQQTKSFRSNVVNGEKAGLGYNVKT